MASAVPIFASSTTIEPVISGVPDWSIVKPIVTSALSPSASVISNLISCLALAVVL